MFSLWRRDNARNVRLYYLYWQYTNLFTRATCGSRVKVSAPFLGFFVFYFFFSYRDIAISRQALWTWGLHINIAMRPCALLEFELFFVNDCQNILNCWSVMWLASILIIYTLTMLTIAHADRGRPTLKDDERFRNRMDLTSKRYSTSIKTKKVHLSWCSV